MLMIGALLANIIIVILEFYALGHINGKRNILKYYTYLQNLLALIASLIFTVFGIIGMVFNRQIPEFVKGFRYIATCGLVATMFIFITFLGNGRKIAITDKDFCGGFSPKMANAILHYVCPLLSLISFVLLEREIPLCNGIWTGIVAIPSCAYWVIYLILSVTKKWEEPYQFSSPGKGNKFLDHLLYFILPLSFIAISFILWNAQF